MITLDEKDDQEESFLFLLFCELDAAVLKKQLLLSRQERLRNPDFDPLVATAERLYTKFSKKKVQVGAHVDLQVNEIAAGGYMLRPARLALMKADYDWELAVRWLKKNGNLCRLGTFIFDDENKQETPKGDEGSNNVATRFVGRVIRVDADQKEGVLTFFQRGQVTMTRFKTLHFSKYTRPIEVNDVVTFEWREFGSDNWPKRRFPNKLLYIENDSPEYMKARVPLAVKKEEQKKEPADKQKNSGKLRNGISQQQENKACFKERERNDQVEKWWEDGPQYQDQANKEDSKARQEPIEEHTVSEKWAVEASNEMPSPTRTGEIILMPDQDNKIGYIKLTKLESNYRETETVYSFTSRDLDSRQTFKVSTQVKFFVRKRWAKNIQHTRMKIYAQAINSSNYPHPAGNKNEAVNVESVTTADGKCEEEGLFYVQGLQFTREEDEETEFKMVSGKNLVYNIKCLLPRYLNGFFNSNGGTLYLGINDNGIIVGLPLTFRERDKLRVMVDNSFANFEPSIASRKEITSVQFIDVYGGNGLRLTDVFVLKIVTKKGDKTERPFWEVREWKYDGSAKVLNCYVRGNASTRRMSEEEREELRRKHEKQNNQNPEEKIGDMLTNALRVIVKEIQQNKSQSDGANQKSDSVESPRQHKKHQVEDEDKKERVEKKRLPSDRYRRLRSNSNSKRRASSLKRSQPKAYLQEPSKYPGYHDEYEIDRVREIEAKLTPMGFDPKEIRHVFKRLIKKYDRVRSRDVIEEILLYSPDHAKLNHKRLAQARGRRSFEYSQRPSQWSHQSQRIPRESPRHRLRRKAPAPYPHRLPDHRMIDYIEGPRYPPHHSRLSDQQVPLPNTRYHTEDYLPARHRRHPVLRRRHRPDKAPVAPHSQPRRRVMPEPASAAPHNVSRRRAVPEVTHRSRERRPRRSHSSSSIRPHRHEQAEFEHLASRAPRKR